MTATAIETSSGTSGWTDKHTGVAGILFAVLMVAGISVGSDSPGYDESAEVWTRWYEDSGNRQLQVLGIFLLLFAVIALVGFVAGLLQRARADQNSSDALTTITAAGGVILAMALMFGGILARSVSGAIEFGDIEIPGADTLIMAEQAGFGILLLGGGVGAFLLIGGTSLISRNTGVLPSWLAIVGLVIAFVVLFTSVFFLPMVLVPLWAVAASISLLRSTSRAEVMS